MDSNILQEMTWPEVKEALPEINGDTGPHNGSPPTLNPVAYSIKLLP